MSRITIDSSKINQLIDYYTGNIKDEKNYCSTTDERGYKCVATNKSILEEISNEIWAIIKLLKINRASLIDLGCGWGTALRILGNNVTDIYGYEFRKEYEWFYNVYLFNNPNIMNGSFIYGDLTKLTKAKFDKIKKTFIYYYQPLSNRKEMAKLANNLFRWHKKVLIPYGQIGLESKNVENWENFGQYCYIHKDFLKKQLKLKKVPRK